MSVRNHDSGGSIPRVSEDVVKAVKNTTVELQRVLVHIEVADRVGTEVWTEQESVIAVPRREGVPVTFVAVRVDEADSSDQ
jgi:hypothetical protein